MLPDSLRQQLAQQKDTPAYKFFREHAGLPEAIRNTAPPAFRNKFTAWVWMEQATIEGAIYYRIHIHQPFRSYHLVVTPFLAYMFGHGLAFLREVPQIADIVLTGEPTIGEVVVPKWAVDRVLKEFSSIIEANEESVKLLVEEVHRLKKVDADDEEAPETRTLH